MRKIHDNPSESISCVITRALLWTITWRLLSGVRQDLSSWSGDCFLKPCKTVLKDMSRSHHHITSSTVSCQQLCANFTYWHKYHWKDLFFFIRKKSALPLPSSYFSYGACTASRGVLHGESGPEVQNHQETIAPSPWRSAIFWEQKTLICLFLVLFFPTRLFEKYVRQICVQISPDDSLWFMMVLTQDSQTLERSPKNWRIF